MVTKSPSLHPSPTVNTGRSVGNGAAPLQGLSPPVQVSLEVEVTEGSSFLLYDRPSVLGWMLGLGTDTTEEQELSGKRVALS